MISLFLNIFSNYLNVGIYKDGKVIDSIYEKYDKDLSKEALYKMSLLLSNNSLDLDEIDEIVCVRGPGSFTGLRIGVTISKTIAYFLNKELYSASSLDVMATSVSGDIIVSLINARRGYVYAAIYDREYNVLFKESYIKLEDLLKKVDKYDGKVVFVSLDEFDFDTIMYKPNLDRFYRYDLKKKENSMSFIPKYLKKTEAEEKLNDKRD